MANEFIAIPANDARWQTWVQQCQHDFYHTAFYHKLEQAQGEPVLLVGQSDTELLLLPLLLRPVFETELYDATSVYGYAGPIANKPMEKITPEFLTFFKREADNFFKQQNIVSVFSRLHPLIVSQPLFSGWGITKALNKTVLIDLQQPLAVQRAQYRKSNRSEINQLIKKKGYLCEQLKGDDELKRFVEIYQQTMQKVTAAEYYFFDETYFKQFLQNGNFESFVLLAKVGNTIAAGALFTISGNIMQYHLAGTDEAYAKDTPMKLIIDTARLIANKRKLQCLHLGGGVGGQDGDSLFNFKAGFSKDFAQFRVWNYIVDENAYQQLLSERGMASDPDDNFFPLYRKPKLNKAN